MQGNAERPQFAGTGGAARVATGVQEGMPGGPRISIPYSPYHAHWQHAADVLTEPWPERGRRRTLLRAAITLALSFDTWRTLTREQQLTDDQALELMLRLTCDCSFIL
jgi:hypothetical protein